MKTRFGLIALAAATLLAGCAGTPQQPVSLSKDLLAPANGRIGVAMTAVPKADTTFPGAGCLLCLAAASAMNSSLTTHTKTLGVEDLPQLKKSVAEQIRKSGVEVVEIDADIKLDDLPRAGASGPNIATHDFSSFQQKYKIDKLVVIDIEWLGFKRNYASYIPTDEPKGTVDGTGFMVNLKTNTYEWYEQLKIIKSSDGNWDEPPKFPGLTNAYYQALELTKDGFLKPFQVTR